MRAGFRRLQPSENTTGYSVWMEAYDWLAVRKIRQWLVPMPLEEFEKRTSAGANYGWFEGQNLVAVAALSRFVDDHWTNLIGPEPRWWLGALAVRSSMRGRKIGRQLVALAGNEALAAGATELYLDCVTGPLPDYYASLGFERCGGQTVNYRSGNQFPMVLMRSALPIRIAMSPQTNSAVT